MITSVENSKSWSGELQQKAARPSQYAGIDRQVGGSQTAPPRKRLETPRPPPRPATELAGPSLVPSAATAELATHPRFKALLEYGKATMAYATLQPGLQYFESHDGYLAYDTYWGTPYVLSDPIAPVENYDALVDAFVTRYPNACFCQISRPTAEVLSRRGWYVNEMGCDMELDLPTYDFAGPKKSKLRQAAAKVERERYTIDELPADQVDPEELHHVCTAWRASKTVQHELRFLVRPLALHDEPEVRKFYLRDPDGRLVSVVFFDPICEAGQVIGYSPAVKRRSPAAPTGAEEAVTKFAIERFQQENRRVLRLGLMPFFEVDDSEFRHRWMIKKVFQLLYEHGDRWIYSFKGHADFKRRYRGTLLKNYFAIRGRFTPRVLLGLLRLSRIV